MDGTLARLGPADLATARPVDVRAGIVHLGVGNFHRGHQAAYIDGLLARQPEWGIIGASLHRPDVRDALKPQDCCYSVVRRAGPDTHFSTVGALLDVLVLAEDPGRLQAILADPAVRIASLTVTEKGCCHDPATGDLDTSLPAVQGDIIAPHQPRTAPGLLLEALRQRHAAGLPPLTVVSCDNLPGNGRLLRRVVTQLAMAQGLPPDFVEATATSFPSSMVDRIVPATSAADRAAVAHALGREDAWPVPVEGYTQWVLEDDFVSGRPDLAAVGVELVSDVTPHEHMKLRVLNGAHFALAFLGLARGHEHVAAAMADPSLGRFVEAMLRDEVLPTFAAPAGADADAYVTTTLARFADPGIRHRLAQISTDGSRKLGMRILEPLAIDLAAGRAAPRLELVVAAWLAHWHGRLGTAAPLAPDPMHDLLAGLQGRHPADVGSFVSAAIPATRLFGDLAGAPGLPGRLAAAARAWSAAPGAALG